MIQDVLAGRRLWHIEQGDALAVLRGLPDGCVQCCITSPPYWGMRKYLVDGDPLEPLELGRERTPQEYVARLVEIFREVRRVLRADGVVWLNLGDCYASPGKGGPWDIGRSRNGKRAPTQYHYKRQPNRFVVPGLKNKNLVGLPWMVAFALQADGWYLRCDVVWDKLNALPDGAADRPSRTHEYMFLFSKRERYFFDELAIRQPLRPKTLSTYGITRKKTRHGEPPSRVKSLSWGHTDQVRQPAVYADGTPLGASMRSVWRIAREIFKGPHYATFPPALVEPCIAAGTSSHGCCRQCGAPYVRLVKRWRTLDGVPRDDLPPMRNTDTHRPSSAQGVGHWRIGVTVQVLGWRPSCRCKDQGEPLPCVVLDPFSGAGTTGLVARRFNRRFLGSELDPASVAMARKRIIEDAPLFNGEAAS